MRKTMVLFVMMALFICMVQPAFADMQPIFEAIPTDIVSELSMNNEWSKMRARSNPDNTFKQVEYYVKSTGATSGIRYRMKEITFKVGQYGPGSLGAAKFRSNSPGPGETIYDKVILPRDFFRGLLGSTFPNGPQLVGEALDTENYLYVGAVLEIYNANTGQVLETITSEEECQTKGAAQGFAQKDIADMKSRWQQVPLRTAPSPDFFPTPEGSCQWQEEYKDPNKGAKTYSYKQGATEITFPVTLRNAGEKAITDFKAVWFG
ncbi:MAG: hypothetical protein PHG58_06245 [Clostridia bacterium]|nr:hypothetical protein [Clostridia bacterium]